jgi:hypothetical protein
MAYIEKEAVANIRKAIKKAFPKSWKFSVTRNHCSEVIIALMEGPMELVETYQQLNHYHSHFYEGEIRSMINKVVSIVNDVHEPVVDRNAGDMGADYGNNNYFLSVHVGKWDRPYLCKKA